MTTKSPCKCGKTPLLTESIKQGIDHQPIYIMRLKCACGASGATLLYAHPHQSEKMAQSAWDGWNLRHK